MSHESCGLRCELVTDFSRLQSFAPAWERLNNESRGSAFQSWGWASAFWKTHGHALTLCAPVIFADDAVVGIVPLVIQNRTVRLLGEPYADYNGPLCLPQRAFDVLNTAFAALLDASFPWTECVFNNLPENSPLLESLERPRWQLRRHFQAIFQYSCPTVRDDGSNVFEQLALKERLRRNENRLRRKGNLEFRHIEDRREIQRHLDEFFAQHATRQSLNGVRSQFLDSAPRAMMRALVEELDPAHQLRFCALALGGRAIAYHFGFQCAGKLIFYVPTFDVNYWGDSPGDVLLRNLFKYAQQEKLSEFDFSIGDEAYKERFANYVGKTWSVYFYRSPRQPQIQVLRAGRSMRDIARRNNRATEIVRRAKQIMARGARLLQPKAVIRSAAAALARVVAVRKEVVCRRMWAVGDAAGAQVRRVELRDLARLTIENAISYDTLQVLRRRVRGGEALYLVSLQTAEYLFWLSEAGGAEAHDSTTRITFEAATLAGRGMHGPAEALVALLCDRQSSSQVCLEIPRAMAVDEVLHRAGYEMQFCRFHIGMLGRSVCRLSQPAMCALKEKECVSEHPPA
ncbi:MAG: GNAT family N-acetyltransferase [Candidatus Korobacteraceae bacterium]|jgi:CelD/BcsL family acetyltransferase involved in cellulose biosynthesis